LVYTILVVPRLRFCLREPSEVFTSEMSAIFVALTWIVDLTCRPDRYLDLTNSMSSLKALQTCKFAPRTHSLVYEIKEAYWFFPHVSK
jgi:hypothetical protein